MRGTLFPGIPGVIMTRTTPGKASEVSDLCVARVKIYMYSTTRLP